MKYALALILSLVSPVTFAAARASEFNVRAMLWDFFVLLGVAAIAGILWYLVDQAPFIVGVIKQVLKFIILLALGILVIYLILGWIGL